MRNILDKLVSPSAFGLPTWVLAFAPSATTAVLHDRNLYGGSIVGWLVSALTGALLAGVILFIAHFSPRSRLNVVLIITVFFLAGIARGIGVGVTAYALELVPDPQFGVRMLSGGILAIFWLSISTIIVASFRSHRIRRQQLLNLETEAKNARNHLVNELSEIKLQAGQQLNRETRKIQKQLSDQIDLGDSRELRVIASNLHDLSSNVVRPLSHAVSASATTLSSRLNPTRHNPTRHRTAYLTLLSDAFTVKPFHPGWIAILLFPSILMTAIRAYGIGLGIFGAAWITAMASVVLLLGQKIFTPSSRSLPNPLQIISVLAIWLLAAVSSSLPVLIASQWGLGPERAYWVFGVPLFAYVPVTCLGLALASALQKEWEMSDDELQSRIESLRWQSMRVEQEIWAQKNQLGRYLHGSVQSTLTSTALFIETSLDQQHDTRTIAREARERLVQVSQTETSPIVSPGTANEVLHRIASVWAQLSEINIEFSEIAEQAVNGDQLAAEHVVELVREGIANAIRHGKASEISISIELSANHTLCIDIDDNGQYATTPTRGLGTTMLNDLCLSWKRAPRPEGGTHLSLILTVGELKPVRALN